MVTRALVPLFALLAAPCAAGCFDVHATDLLVIDNFNDGDLLPAYPGFGVWMGYGIEPKDNPNVHCHLDTDTQDGSPDSLLLEVTVTDVLDGFQLHGGAGLVTNATMGAVDFTRYGRIAFDIKLTSGADYPLPVNALVYLELACSTVRPESHDMILTLYVSQGVPYSGNWQNVALSLVNFGPPQWLTEPIDGGPVACLQHVDGVRFVVDEQLADGQTGHAFLRIDNVVLE